MTWLVKILRIYLERTTVDKVLYEKAFNIAKNQKIIYINVDLL